MAFALKELHIFIASGLCPQQLALVDWVRAFQEDQQRSKNHLAEHYQDNLFGEKSMP